MRVTYGMAWYDVVFYFIYPYYTDEYNTSYFAII